MKLLYIVDRLALTYQNHTSIVIDIWYKLLVQCNVNGECAGLKNHKSLLLMRMGAGEISLPPRMLTEHSSFPLLLLVLVLQMSWLQLQP